MTTTQGTINYDASAALVLAGQAQTALAGAKDFIIDSNEMMEIAADDLRAIKTLQKKVEDQRTSITGPLNKAVKAVNDLFRAPKEYLESAEAILKRAILTYNTEQERIRLEAQRKAEEQARQERERLAEIERQQREDAAKAEAIALQAQAEAQAAAQVGDIDEAERKQREAQAALEQAQAASLEAQTAAQVAHIVTIPLAAPAAAKVTGISGRRTYSAQVDDLMALIQAVSEGKAPLESITADMKFLNAQARAYKRAGQLFPGVTAVEDRSVSARAG